MTGESSGRGYRLSRRRFLAQAVTCGALTWSVAWLATPVVARAQQSKRPAPLTFARIRNPVPGSPGTLNPRQFTGRTAEAYEAAAAVPGVLAQVFCYCGCDTEMQRERFLLECYENDHAVN